MGIAFLAIEQYSVCSKTKLKEGDKVDQHLQAMVSLQYERELIDMSNALNWLDADRRAAFQQPPTKIAPRDGRGAVLTRLPKSRWHGSRAFANFWKASFLGE